MHASIAATHKLYAVQAGMHQFDLMDSIVSKSSRCLINFRNDDDNDTICKLIAWKMVLNGGKTVMQVWSERNESLDLATAFNNRNKTNMCLISLLNVMYYKMFGDKTQRMHLISCFYPTQLRQKKSN